MDNLEENLALLKADVAALLDAQAVALGEAEPPDTLGVYALSVADRIVYIGEAKGSKGLRDRLLSKHISGDDSHAIQRAFLTTHPLRATRREHIKKVVSARWLVIDDPGRVSAVEKVLIWLLKPEWNKT
jgi:hypothetical protein